MIILYAPHANDSRNGTCRQPHIRRLFVAGDERGKAHLDDHGQSYQHMIYGVAVVYSPFISPMKFHAEAFLSLPSSLEIHESPSTATTISTFS